jgi:hypothetical protein
LYRVGGISGGRQTLVQPGKSELLFMYIYSAYGLGIRSTLELPELFSPAGARADVRIRTRRAASSPHAPKGAWGGGPPARLPAERSVRVTPGEACLSWNQIGTFYVRGAREITIEPHPGVEEPLLRLALLGPVLALLLHQRGYLVLHASAVAREGSAIVFLGEKGAGKSTTAAALCAGGYQLLADDLVALELTGADRPQVLPGYPQLKLWPSAAIALGDDPASLPPLSAGQEKRSRRMADRFAPGPLPLERLYVLSEGPSLEIEPLAPQETILQLIGHSYSSRFGKELLRGPAAAQHLLQCKEVAAHAPIYLLRRPLSLQELPDLARRVEMDRCAA